MRIPFNSPHVGDKEHEYVADCLASDRLAGDGLFSERCTALLRQELGVPSVLLTPSCTHALEMAAMLLDVGPGDDVIVPSYTFVSTVNAFVLRGAQPVFADIRSDTLNLDERSLEPLITTRTKAIVPVHYGGVGCEMDAILAIAQRHGVTVVEDNAHGLFGQYRGKYLGTFGKLAAQSFHETKNFTCGEGGALLINDVGLLERAEVIREKGTDRSKFFRGQVDKYTWVDTGSSYLLSDILAAVLLAQLEAREDIQARRGEIWERYRCGLSDWAASRDVHLPTVPDHCAQAFHMFYMILPSLDARQSLIGFLRKRSILSVFHYMPLHLSPMGYRLGGRVGDCPVAEDMSDRLVRLPFYTGLTEGDQNRVIAAVLDWPAHK